MWSTQGQGHSAPFGVVQSSGPQVRASTVFSTCPSRLAFSSRHVRYLRYQPRHRITVLKTSWERECVALSSAVRRQLLCRKCLNVWCISRLRVSQRCVPAFGRVAIELHSRSVNSLEKVSDRLQHLEVPYASSQCRVPLRWLISAGTALGSVSDSEGKPARYVRLMKSFNGLTSAPRAWWLDITQKLSQLGWKPMSTDQSLWCRCSDDGELKGVTGIHVDDFLIGLANGDTGENWMSEIKVCVSLSILENF